MNLVPSCRGQLLQRFVLVAVVMAVSMAVMACSDEEAQLWGPTGPQTPEDDRVLGGEVAEPGAFPSTVRLGIASGDIELPHCGGTLIAPSWVLTAAHCVLEKDGKTKINPAIFRVIVGPSNEEVGKGEKFKVVDTFPHDKYIPLSNDVALLKLEKPANGPSIQMFDPRSDSNLLTPGAIAFVAGWGRVSGVAGQDEGSTKLLFSRLPFVPDAVCREAIATKAPADLKYFDGSLMLCAGGEAGRDSCHGDSGGPLMLRREPSSPWLLVGAVSWGATVGNVECGADGVPGVYAEVAAMQEFIRQELSKGGLARPTPPGKIRTANVTAAEIQLRWDDVASNETHFIVAVSHVGSERWQYFRSSANSTGKNFKLSSPSVYWLAIQACNSSGCSNWTETLTVTAR